MKHLLKWEPDGRLWSVSCGATGKSFPGLYTLEESIQITLALRDCSRPLSAWEIEKLARSALASRKPSRNVGDLSGNIGDLYSLLRLAS